MPETIPSPLALALSYLRAARGWTRMRLARALGYTGGSLLARYEAGTKPLTRESLDALIAPLQHPPAAAGAEPPDLTVLEPVLLAMMPYLIEEGTAVPERPSTDEERRDAEAIWTALERFPVSWRRRLIELSPRAGNWALAARACQASAEAAAHDSREALELAELAFSIAERVPGEESDRVKGTCRERLVNARLEAADGLSGTG